MENAMFLAKLLFIAEYKGVKGTHIEFLFSHSEEDPPRWSLEWHKDIDYFVSAT